MLILICLLLAYCGQKEVRYAWERNLAKNICEASGGGGVRSNGPLEVAGFLNLQGGGLYAPKLEQGSPNWANQQELLRGNIFKVGAKYLLKRDFEFIEFKTHSLRSRLTTGFVRITLENNPSPLCAVFDAYESAYKNYNGYRGDAVINREEKFWQNVKLPDNACIGLETFSEPSLLRSEYELLQVRETEPELPKITWNRTQVRSLLTGEVMSEYASFFTCLGAYLQIEPIYSDCAGGSRNRVQCPVETSRRKFNPVTRFHDEAFVPRKRL